MTTPIKALFATVATGVMAFSAVAPAMARDNVGIGIHIGDGYGQHYGRGWNQGNPRQAVNTCTAVAENQASRNAYARAHVTDIRDVHNTRSGFEVRGRIAVNSRDHGWNNRGWNDNRNSDTGSFTCRVEHGRVAFLDFDGIRGL